MKGLQGGKMCICDMICVYLGSFKCVNVCLFTQTKSPQGKDNMPTWKIQVHFFAFVCEGFCSPFFFEFDACIILGRE